MKQDRKILKNIKRSLKKKKLKGINGVEHWGHREYPNFSNGAISIVIISDLHCGSIKGACSSNPILQNKDSFFPITPEQKEIRSVLQWGADNLIKKHIDVLVINGEGIDGDNRHQNGNQSWTSDHWDQVRDCVKLLHELFTWDICYVCRGSKYHVQTGATDWDEVLAHELGAVYNSPHIRTSATDSYGVLELPTGLRLIYSHHIPYRADEALKGTPLSKELANCQRHSNTWAEIHIRSHIHTYGKYEAFFEDIRPGETNEMKLCTIISTPACKYPDSFTEKFISNRESDIGFVEILVEQNGETHVNPLVGGPARRKQKASNVLKELKKFRGKKK